MRWSTRGCAATRCAGVPVATNAVLAAKPSSRLKRFLASDIAWSFRKSPVAIGSAIVLLLIVVSAFAAL